MKLSTRAKYGLRICFLMAVGDGNYISLATLVRQTNLSEKYLEQLIGKLRRAEVVNSTRGANGGYRLARQPSEITLKDMLVALDDSFDVNECLGGDCHDAYCPNRKIFQRIYDGFDHIMSDITLQDMVNDYKCK